MVNTSLIPRRSWIEEKDLDAPRLIEVRQVWDVWRDGHHLLTWSIDRLLDLDLSLLPFTAVVVKRSDGSGNEYIYWGSALTGIFGDDLTGKAPGILHKYPQFDQGGTSYDVNFEEGRPRYLVTKFLTSTGQAGLQLCIRLPFGVEGAVDHVLSIALFNGPHGIDMWNSATAIYLLAQQMSLEGEEI
ncbi:MAG: hypothetical protein HON14_12785 [Rhodospirillaceae bacterium]|nr:hypothetical protein [Rhodospirillaceae bacterium]